MSLRRLGEPVTGTQGADGASAYQVAVANGFSGTEAQWLASLHGADGADGAPGPQGPAGPAGADGAPGVDGGSPIVHNSNSYYLVTNGAKSFPTASANFAVQTYFVDIALQPGQTYEQLLVKTVNYTLSGGVSVGLYERGASIWESGALIAHCGWIQNAPTGNQAFTLPEPFTATKAAYLLAITVHGSGIAKFNYTGVTDASVQAFQAEAELFKTTYSSFRFGQDTAINYTSTAEMTSPASITLSSSLGSQANTIGVYAKTV